MSTVTQFPNQKLPFKKKNKVWRKSILDWADDKTFLNFSPVRNSVYNKKINYDLLNGILHMKDLEYILNPDNLDASYIPDSIPHYPIMNSKLEVLRGEELSRVFDLKVTITNPNAISDIENKKKEEFFLRLQELIVNTSLNEEEFQKSVQNLQEYYKYEWQDIREIRANYLLNHYNKEQNLPLMFNNGFMDALTVGEEIYMCDIVGGEPIVERLNPLKVRIFRSGFSNKIEDADLIIIEDYWSPGRIIDTYYDVLTEKDMRYIESIPNLSYGKAATDGMDNRDERFGFINNYMEGDILTSQDNFFFNPTSEVYGTSSLLPYDFYGNIKVLRVFWKSYRKVKVVKYYDETTGEELHDIFPEDYVVDESKGEVEKELWINQAWEGVKIGEKIYVNMRPRIVQYNKISNPSKCHFGIIGNIYNLNESKPFSMVDKMKKYNYSYDAIHDKLIKLIANNWGKLVELDLSKVPSGWEVDKWMYFARVNHLVVKDSFKEGDVGGSTGVLSGALNNNSRGVVDASLGNEIQFHISLLEFLKGEMSEVAGISKQREGQISNRETVGGVERATLQSSHITEWLFATHDDVKRRVYECFLETAKIAIKGRSIKFPHILPEGFEILVDIDGDEFAENDYGLVVDNSNDSQKLKQNLEVLAQAALQKQTLNFSTIMKLYSSSSLIEKQRMVEQNEKEMVAQKQQEQQMLMQQQQMEIQANLQIEQAKLEQAERFNNNDNATKIEVAKINSEAEVARLALMNGDYGIKEPEFTEEARAKLKEQIREFNERLKFDEKKLNINSKLKEKQIVEQAKKKNNGNSN